VAWTAQLCLSQTVQNPSFEDHTSIPVGWTAYGNGAGDLDVHVWTVPTYGVSEAADGARIWGVVKDGSRTSGGIYQVVSGISPGARYEAAVSIYTHRTGNGEMTCTIGLDPLGGTDPGGSQITWFEGIHSDNEWRRISVRATASSQSTAVTIFLGFHQSGSTGFAINYFDKVELIPFPPPPPDCADLPPYIEARLSDHRIDLLDEVEAQYTVPRGYVITGIGARGSDANVSRMRVRQNRLLPDGSLGEPQEVRFGYDPYGGLEANITLPDCYVAVGYGARAAGEFDIMTLAVWGRPILPGGSLGPVKEFRAGYEAYNPGLEKQFVIGGSRVLTGVGLRMQYSDITNIWAETDLFDIRPIPGDLDGDGDVDQEDFGRLQRCLTGDGIPQDQPDCDVADIDGDGDVDSEDVGFLIQCFSGPDEPADPECAPI